MGASLDYRIFDTADKSEIIRMWDESRQLDRAISGSQEGYSGTINNLGKINKWVNTPMPDRDSAENYLADKGQKYDVWAIPFYYNSTEMASTAQAIKDLTEQIVNIMTDVEKNMHEQLDIDTVDLDFECPQCDTEFSFHGTKPKQKPVKIKFPNAGVTYDLFTLVCPECGYDLWKDHTWVYVFEEPIDEATKIDEQIGKLKEVRGEMGCVVGGYAPS